MFWTTANCRVPELMSGQGSAEMFDEQLDAKKRAIHFEMILRLLGFDFVRRGLLQADPDVLRVSEGTLVTEKLVLSNLQLLAGISSKRLYSLTANSFRLLQSRLAFLDSTAENYARSTQHVKPSEATSMLYASLLGPIGWGEIDISHFVYLIFNPRAIAPILLRTFGTPIPGQVTEAAAAAELIKIATESAPFLRVDSRALNQMVGLWTRWSRKSTIQTAQSRGYLTYPEAKALFNFPDHLVAAPPIRLIRETIVKYGFAAESALFFWKCVTGLPELTVEQIQTLTGTVDATTVSETLALLDRIVDD